MFPTSLPIPMQIHRAHAFGHTKDEDQEFFIRNSDVCINHCVEKIFKKYLSQKAENPSTSSCFAKTIDMTSSFRKKIALKQEEKNAKAQGLPYDPSTCRFGVSRLKAELPTVYEVVLGKLYEPTGNKLATQITQSLEACKAFDEFLGTEVSCATLDRSSLSYRDEKGLFLHIDWKFFCKEEIDPSAADPTQVKMEDLLSSEKFMMQINELQKSKGGITKADLEEITSASALTLVRQRKERNPAQFWFHRDISILKKMQQKWEVFQSLRPSDISSSLDPNGFIIGTLSYSIQGKAPVVLTKYSTYFESRPNESKEDILVRIRKKSFVTLCHQDVTDLNTTLSDANLYFDDAIHWTSDQGIDALQDTVGKMIFLLAHNHRDMRGTAAETEWIEKAIYKLHGFELPHDEQRMPDLIAFGNYDMNEYLVEYKRSTPLKTA